MATILASPIRNPSVAALRVTGTSRVIAYLGAVYIAAHLVLSRLLPGAANVYVAQPLLWLGLAALCWSGQRELAARPAPAVLAAGLLAAAFQVATLTVAGLLYGFGHSPYARGELTIGLNLGYLASMLLGLEAARAYLLGDRATRPAVRYIGTTSLLALVAVPPALWQASLAGGRPAFEVVGGVGLPAFAESALAGALALAGGPWAAFAYRFTVGAAEWTAPVLPDLPWMAAALAGTMAPATALLLLQPRADTSAARGRGVPGWLSVFAAAAVGVVLLNTGLLGLRPAFVSGVSMEPNLVLGDIVVTRQVAPEAVHVGDIVRFQSGAVPVLHRVIEVRRGADGLVFVTQGDNNNLPDAPVPAAAVEGRVILKVSKLGIVPIKLRVWLAEALR